MAGNWLIRKGQSKVVAFVLVLSLILSGFGFIASNSEEVYATPLNTLDTAKTALIKAYDYYKTERDGELTDWEELLAIYSVGKIPGQALDLKQWKLPAIPAVGGGVNSYLPAMVTSLIRGSDIGDLTSELLGQVNNEGVFSIYADVQAQAMLAVEIASRAGVAIGGSYDGSKAAAYLLSLQKPGGGFTGQYDFGLVTNDTTGYAAQALAPYTNIEELKTSISAIVEYFNTSQLDSGGFEYHYAAGPGWEAGSYESANSTAVVVWGLSALNKATTDDNLKTSINAIMIEVLPALTKWQNEDGSFGFSDEGQGSFDAYTSKQVMIALYMIASEKNPYNEISKNAEELTDFHVRIESDTHKPVDVNISPAKNDSMATVGAIAWAKANMDGSFVENEYKVTTVPATTVGTDALFVANSATTRSAFEITSIEGEMNQPQTVRLINPVSNQPLSNVVITVNGNFAGYDSDTWAPLATDVDGKLTIPGENFLQAGKYEISTAGEGISRDTCIIAINSGTKTERHVSVRIEGINSNILFEKKVVVETSGDKILTAEDAIVQALTDKEVDNLILGGYIVSIGSITDNYFNLLGSDYDYWGFYINNDYSNFGIGNTVIEDGDEILLFYGNSNTQLPSIHYAVDSNNVLKVTAHNSYNSALTGANITIIGSGMNLSGVTNDEGIVTFGGISAGAYEIQAVKYDETVSSGGLYLPLIVRLEPGYTINIPANQTLSSNEVVDVSGGTTTPLSITVAQGAQNTTLETGTDSSNILPQIDVEIPLNSTQTVTLHIPQGTSVSALSGGWDGKIYLPQVVTKTLDGKDIALAISVGSNTKDIEFSQPVRLLFPDSADMKVGYIDSAGKFTEITTELASDKLSQVELQLNAAKSQAGKINVGDDLAVWTKHFSTYIVYEDSTPSSGNEGGGSATKDSVTLQVIGFNGKSSYNILSATKIEFGKNDTAISILQKAGITITQSGGYVSAINGLEEKEHGPYSGWKVSINGTYIPHSAGSYTLKNGDKIIWKYVTEVNEGEESDQTAKPELPYDEESVALAVAQFDDVGHDSWFATAVGYLFEKGIFTGTSADKFSPDASLSRAMLASVLARISGADLTVYQTSAGDNSISKGFTDVDVNSWYGPSVAWAKEVGVVSGYENKDGSFAFRPDNKISRQDITVMINNFNEKVQKKTYAKVETVDFIDQADIAGYAKVAVAAMQEAGIISGFQETDGSYSFRPVENTSRAQAASLIYNVLTK